MINALNREISREIGSEINQSVLQNPVAQSAAPQSAPLSYALQSVNPHFHELLQLAETVAKSKAAVMIQGDPGSGKNILARYLFQKSQRSHKAFQFFKCKEIALGNQEQMLLAAVEQCMGGTILLTDITYLGAAAQARLLQFIQDGLDIRWIATTSRSLTQFVKGGDFREDLFYRLNVVSLKVPSLVDRMGDIELLAKVFVDRFAKTHARGVNRLSLEAIQLLNGHRWPGNIRELESVIERAVLLAPNDEIRARDISIQTASERGFSANGATVEAVATVWKPGRTLDEIERNVILDALKHFSGNRTHTAKALGISIRTLRNKLAEYRVMGINA